MKPLLARYRSTVLTLLLLTFVEGRSGRAYSLLTHEQLVDLTWQDSIVPLLLSRYPALAPAQIEHARAYAYGGCVIQDIGYYPFGDASFSNLTHYVRSGDFVVNLFRNAGNADELAFAVGALSHYIGDTVGHKQATNLAVPIEFPELRAKYGTRVNYAEGEHQHVQTEFAFDINENVHQRLGPVNYFRHVGLQVPTRQLALAFYQTYGLTENFTGVSSRRVNVRAYRFAVHSFIPEVAEAVTLLHRSHEPRDSDTPKMTEMLREVDRIAVENNWVAYRRKPGIGTYSLAGLLLILPKFGPLKLVAVKGPTVDTEMEYIDSVIFSTIALRSGLARFTPPPSNTSSTAMAVAAVPTSSSFRKPVTSDDNEHTLAQQTSDGKHPLKNRDLDTGDVVRSGGYPLTDRTYASLLHRLARKSNQAIPVAIKEDVLAFYAHPDAPNDLKRKPKEWAIVQADLVVVRGMATSTEPEPFPTYDREFGLDP